MTRWSFVKFLVSKSYLKFVNYDTFSFFFC